jgi:predicted nucleic acid-binding protein
MKVLLDTSVLVAAMISAHTRHARALPCLQAVKQGVVQGIVAAHSLAECYAVMSGLPVKPRLSPKQVRQLLRDNLETDFQIHLLSLEEYLAVLDALTTSGLSGGVVYDALILQIARRTSVDRVYTFNRADFLRIAPDWADRLIEP